MTFIFKFEEVKTPYGQIPGPGIDPKVVNVNNSLTTRHKLLKIDTRGIFYDEEFDGDIHFES